MLRTDDLEYHLPRELIAVRPAEPRDAARMLVIRRSDDRMEHCCVRDLPSLLQSGDAMVFNRSAVVPARLLGRHADTGGAVEGLFLAEIAAGEWRVMLSSNRRLRTGMTILLDSEIPVPNPPRLELVIKEGDAWTVRLDDSTDSGAMLEQVGRTPLPPYILKARGESVVSDALDRAWYQTVYASARDRHSVAAPTAGLHFTPRLLEALEQRAVDRFDVILHVGPGTFKPITTLTVEAHPMHAEEFEVPSATLDLLESRRAANEIPPRRRIIAVGTTTVRTLESIVLGASLQAGDSMRGSTRLLICPPYAFRHVDGLLTNFHLPRSTLLALVAAMIGLDRLKRAYAEAIREGYRFYSYGDAMLILP